MLMVSVFESMLANCIYDGMKKVLKTSFHDSMEDSDRLRQIIEKVLSEKINAEDSRILDSSSVREYYRSPMFLDELDAYIKYTSYGCGWVEVPRNQNAKSESVRMQFVNHTAENILKIQKENKVVNPIDLPLLKATASRVLNCFDETIYECLDVADKGSLYLIAKENERLKKEMEHLLNRTEEYFARCRRYSYEKNVDDFEEVRKEYIGLLKNRFARDHIYLLDKFELDKFYVAPKMRLHRKRKRLYINDIETQECRWEDIFCESNIVYVIGGAGYGKSLFLKNIINHHELLNINKPEEYLIIYGELKVLNGNKLENIPSIDELLQKYIKISTMMDESRISKEMIEFYMNQGKCIVLLDALDEIELASRNELHAKIVNYFKNQNPNNKVCITSRARGFIPESDVVVYDISDLTINETEAYLDRLIDLGKFDPEDKKPFVDQAKDLIRCGFLRSFLILSLLVNIYKAERVLPENKLELYQKCFEYISSKREKDKNNLNYDWSLIKYLMRDTTFSELSELCLPNNSEVSGEIIEKRMEELYANAYSSKNELSNAIETFLTFCSDRTELFVPGSEENKYKFFHRSFFEYFYSQQIVFKNSSIENTIDSMKGFGIDSEVCELVVAILKQKHEVKYQKVIEYLITESIKEFQEKKDFCCFKLLILSMQIVDEFEYKRRFLNLLVDNKAYIINHLTEFDDFKVLRNVFLYDKMMRERILKEYYDYAQMGAIYYIVFNWYFWVQASKRVEEPMNQEVDNKLYIIPVEMLTQYYSPIKPMYSFCSRIFIDQDDLESEIDILFRDIDKIFNPFGRRSYIKKLKGWVKKVHPEYEKMDPEEKQRFIKYIKYESRGSFLEL